MMKIQNFNYSMDLAKSMVNGINQKNKANNLENQMKSAAKSKEKEELKEACNQFEEYFLNQLMKEMRTTVDKSSLVNKGQAEEMFTEMLDQELTKGSVKAGGIGISDMLFKQLNKNY